jgi:hypothetical protein
MSDLKKLLDTEIKLLDIEKRIIKIIFKIFIKKIVLACYDLSNKEKICNIPKSIFIRSNKYIFDDDDDNIILNKEKALYEVLINLDDNKREMLYKRLKKEIVDEIINFLKNKLINYKVELDEDYIEWFEE